MQRRHVIYAGPAFAGRRSSLEVLSPTSERAPRRPREPLQFSFAGQQVCVVTTDLGNLDFPSLLAARRAEEPWVRERVERLIAFLPVLDAVVLVCDSQPERVAADREALDQLIELIASEGLDPARVPFVFQLNKRDLRAAASVEAMRAALTTPRCAHVESVALHRHGVHRALATALALAEGGAPELRDDTAQESFHARDTDLTLALDGPAAVAAIWPKELLGELTVSPGSYAITLFDRVVEFDGLSGVTRVPARVGARARLAGAEVVRVESLPAGGRHPFRVIFGARAAVDAATQEGLPSASYLAAARGGVAVVGDQGGFAPATTGALAIVAVTGAPWIGFDRDGAIVEIGAADPDYADLAGRSVAL